MTTISQLIPSHDALLAAIKDALSEELDGRFDLRDAHRDRMAGYMASRAVGIVMATVVDPVPLPDTAAVSFSVADVIDADPLLRELISSIGPARGALGHLQDILKESGGRMPIALIVFSRMVDAFRRRMGNPALDELRCLWPEAQILTPEQIALNSRAWSPNSRNLVTLAPADADHVVLHRSTIEETQRHLNQMATDLARAREEAKQAERDREMSAATIDRMTADQLALAEENRRLAAELAGRPRGEADDVVFGMTDDQLRAKYGPRLVDVACDRIGCGAQPGQRCIDAATGLPFEHPRHHHGERAAALQRMLGGSAADAREPNGGSGS